MDKATPTPASVDKQAALVAKLRYMGKQYAAGQVARGGAPQKHYLEEAADEIEMMAWALSMNKVTLESAQENAALRNVIQAACIDGLPGLARAWEKYFPDHPITIKGAEVERLAAQVAPTGNSNGETKLWLWKNFVGGSPEYWAFDNPYPINLDNGDPQTLGEPCGYAILKPSRSGRPDFSEDEVLLRIAQAESKVSYNLDPNKANADAFDFLRFAKKNLDTHAARVPFANNGLVTAAVAWIQSAEKILAAQSPAQAPVVQAVQAGEYPPLPQGKAVIRCVADTDEGGWVVDFDCEGPLSHEPQEGDELFTADQMHAYVDADRAAAQVEQSMPSSEWLAEFSSLLTNIENARWSEGSASANFDKLGEKNYEAEAVETRAALLAHLSKRVTAQVEPVRMLTQVELTAALDLTDTFDAIQANAIRAFCRVNAGKRIPADGEVRS